MVPNKKDKACPIQLMGVLNTTPDSFADGGLFVQPENALKHALQLIEEGADILDIGGESSRPNAKRVSLAEELRRTIPIIKAIRTHSNITISIDTTKPEVMKAALAAGADWVNDISALGSIKSLDLMTQSHCKVCLMHMQGNPQNMQNNPQYENVVPDVLTFFRQKIERCTQAGIARKRLIIDPGFGFGKTTQHNLSLLNHLATFKQLDLPILVGLSRKSMIDTMLGGGTKPQQRLIGSIVAALRAVQHGASIIRTHDIKQYKEALQVWYYDHPFS